MENPVQLELPLEEPQRAVPQEQVQPTPPGSLTGFSLLYSGLPSSAGSPTNCTSSKNVLPPIWWC